MPYLIETLELTNDGKIDIADLTRLTDYLYGSQAPFICEVDTSYAHPEIAIGRLFENDTTRLFLQSPVVLRGLELVMSGPDSAVLMNMAGNGLELVNGQLNDSLRIGLLDTNGVATIGAGYQQILKIPGNYQIKLAFASDLDHHSQPVILVDSIPVTFNVTGGGSYCQGGAGMPVGVDSSATGVTYILYKNRVAQTPTITGTGAAISFGNQLAGSYTVSGVKGPIHVPMTGSAIITEFPVVPVSVSIEADTNNSCTGTMVTFTATPVNGGTPSYQWFVNSQPAGSNLPSYSYIPQNNDHVYVVMTSGIICTTGNPATSDTVTMVVYPRPVPSLSGPAEVCVNSSGIVYTTESGKVNYLWTVSPGGTINTGGTTSDHTASVSWNTAGNNTVTVNYTTSDGCTAVNPTEMTVMINPLPSPAGSITGPPHVNQGQMGVGYSISQIPDATNYLWNLPAGATIVSGSNTNSIVVNFSAIASSGNISVYGANSCGNGIISPNLYVHVTTIPSVIQLNKLTIQSGQTVCYSASQTIYVSGIGSDFTVQNGGSLTLIAGVNIFLRPTLKVLSGGYLHGYITNNGQYCTATKNALVANPVEFDPVNKEIITGHHVRVYPNPTSGLFTLELYGDYESSPTTVKIYSMRGIKVLQQELNVQQKMEFSLQNMSSGIYFIHVLTGNNSEMIKLIKL